MEFAKSSRRQGALILLEDYPDESLVTLPDLEQFEKIFISSRNDISHIVQKIQDQGKDVEFIPLDLDAVFQMAKHKHLNAMIEFRHWFNSRQLKCFAWIWWLVQPSFRHSFYDRIFNLFLCYELQNLTIDRCPYLNLSCFLYSDINLARLVQFPIPTQIVRASNKNWQIDSSILKDIFRLAIRFFARLAKSFYSQNVTAFKQGDIDVCIVSAGLPVCWEKSKDRIIDRYYTDLPRFLNESGLKVGHVISPGERCPLVLNRREIPSIHWNFSGVCIAAAQTMAFFFMSFLIVAWYRNDLHQNWRLKLLGYYLFTNHRALFTNIACYYAYKRFILKNHPRIVLFYDEVYFSGRALMMAVNRFPKNKRPITVGLQHGIVSENQLTYSTDIGDAEMPFPSCDYFFVQNELAKNCYRRFLPANASNHIKITGLHRIDTSMVSGEFQSDDLLKGLDRNIPIFLLIGGIPTDMRELWHTLATLMKVTPLQLIIKPHPSHPFPKKWLANLNLPEGGRVWYSTGFNLDEVISISDYVIATISTSLLNVISHKKYPIIYSTSGRFDVSEMLPWFEKQKDGAVAHSSIELQKILKPLSTIKPDRPPNFNEDNLIMPPVFGKTSLITIQKEIFRIISDQEFNDQKHSSLQGN